MRIRLLFFLLIFLLPATIRPADYEVTVSVIRVWVKVVDQSGQPVENLTQAEFEVREDNRKMEVTCFEETKVTTTTSEADQEIPAKDFVIFLDLFNTSQVEYLFIRPKLDQFVDHVMAQGRRVMLALLLPNRKMGVVVPFSSDAARVHGVLEKAQANGLRDQSVRNNEEEMLRVLQSGLSGTRRTGADLLRDGFQLAESFSRQEREVSQFSLHALENFGGYLSGLKLDQPAVLLFVSGGFSSDPGQRYFDMVDRAAEELRESLTDPQLAIYHRGSNFDVTKEVQNTIGKLNRLDLTLYSINTRGLILTDPDVAQQHPQLRQGSKDWQAAQTYQDSLIRIANETGGISFYNSQNFKRGFWQVLQDLNHQYLICYRAPEHKKKGEYHSITVACRKTGVEVRHRLGYLD
jgi:VWFA-related protein